MEKTINCGECRRDFTYEPNPKYPDKRKYCKPCGDIKAESYSKFKNASESKPTHQPVPTYKPVPKEMQPLREDVVDAYEGNTDHHLADAEVEVEKIPDQTVSFSSGNVGQIGLEYEIRSREVRCRALASAIEYNTEASNEVLIKLAKQFEKYILGEDE